MKKWVVSPPPPAEFIAEHHELPTIVARLLWNRNLRTQEQIDEFLEPDYSTGIHDPFLFNDMDKAVKLVFDCIENNKKITVHGDYDADGVDAAVVLITTIKKLGGNNIDVFIPHRETDGYGLNPKTVQFLKDTGTHLIITCDCGISNGPEIALARELGMQVIVTDHHAMPPKLPEADAILHPLVPGEKYPDKTLAGGGVAFKLAQGLLKQHQKTHCHSESRRRDEESLNLDLRDPSATPQDDKKNTLPDGQTYESFEKWLLDCVSISTVGDMVPLIGESRTLVRFGLLVMNKTRNIGLRHLLIHAGLMDENGKPKKGAIDARTIGFQIAPRINAAGRMDHANVAFRLLMAETDAEAITLAAQLDQNNLDRQKLTDKLIKEARIQISETNQKGNAMIFVLGEGWSTGILGLIASRVKDEYNRPTMVMGLNAGVIAGSGRSVAGFNMIETMKGLPEFFHKFGGHPMACGFSLKSDKEAAPSQAEGWVLNEFKKAMLAKAETDLKDADTTPQIAIDAEVDLDEIDWKLFDLLEKFEPFGVGNDEPKYAAYNLTVVSIDSVGSTGAHLKLSVKHNSHVIKKTIAFGFGDVERHPLDWKNTLKPGDTIDLAFTVSVNEWNGNRELQLEAKDIHRANLLSSK